MIKRSNRSDIPPFLALDSMIEAKALEANGADIIHLEIGQPSSPAPKAVMQGLIEAMGDGDTHGYSVAKGVPALRDAISAHYVKSYDATISPDQIAVTVGSSTAFA